MSKPFKETTKLEKYAMPAILAIIVLVFTIMAFFVKQPCDIDRVYLWCRLHPMSFFDIIGLLMFYGGALIISGLLPVKLYNEENSVKWNLLWFVLMAGSVIIIWNL